MKIVTLNLHGYHPMGMPERYALFYRWESGKLLVEGQHNRIEPMIFFFTQHEIKEGNSARIRKMAEDISRNPADIYMFQEVSAGFIHNLNQFQYYKQVWGWKEDFCKGKYQKDHPIFKENDRADTNTAVRLKHHLLTLGHEYQCILLCRGNTGWCTGTGINYYGKPLDVCIKSGHGYRTVFKYDESPYPSGILLEGYAILVKKGIKVLDTTVKEIPVLGLNDKFFSAQVVTLLVKENEAEKRLVVCNLHLDHKLKNLEEQASLRLFLEEYVTRQMRQEGLLKNDENFHECYLRNFWGTIVGGDFNAYSRESYQNSPDVGFFPFMPRYVDYKELSLESLSDLDESRYKSWSKLGKESVPSIVKRIEQILPYALHRAASGHGALSLNFSDPLAYLERQSKMAVYSDEEAGPKVGESRIDYLLVDHGGVNENANLVVKEARQVWEENDWESTRGVSDHKGLWVELLPRE